MTTFDQALLQIINDKQSGSVAILQQLIRGVLSYLIRETDTSKSLNTLKDRLPLMRGALGHFAVVGHFLSKFETAITNILIEGKSEDHLFDIVNEYDNRWKMANTQVANAAGKCLDCNNKTILLHSNSSVISSFFYNLQKTNAKVKIIQTESRPENEGRYQAEILADLGFSVTFIIDAAAGFMMDKVDMVLSGADQIHKNYFVNKIGTATIAMFCKHKNIPFHVLADSRKIVHTSANPESLYNIKKPAKDIWKINHDLIHPVNYYFEAIPTASVSSFITENKAYTTGEL